MEMSTHRRGPAQQFLEELCQALSADVIVDEKVLAPCAEFAARLPEKMRPRVWIEGMVRSARNLRTIAEGLQGSSNWLDRAGWCQELGKQMQYLTERGLNSLSNVIGKEHRKANLYLREHELIGQFVAAARRINAILAPHASLDSQASQLKNAGHRFGTQLQGEGDRRVDQLQVVFDSLNEANAALRLPTPLSMAVAVGDYVNVLLWMADAGQFEPVAYTLAIDVGTILLQLEQYAAPYLGELVAAMERLHERKTNSAGIDEEDADEVVARDTFDRVSYATRGFES